MSHLAETFARQPERWRQLQAAPTLLDNTEEIRWSTPVLHMRRTVMSATRNWRARRSGLATSSQWCRVMANYDPDVFEDPHTFDVARPDKGQLSSVVEGHISAAWARFSHAWKFEYCWKRC